MLSLGNDFCSFTNFSLIMASLSIPFIKVKHSPVYRSALPVLIIFFDIFGSVILYLMYSSKGIKGYIVKSLSVAPVPYPLVPLCWGTVIGHVHPSKGTLEAVHTVMYLYIHMYKLCMDKNIHFNTMVLCNVYFSIACLFFILHCFLELIPLCRF